MVNERQIEAENESVDGCKASLSENIVVEAQRYDARNCYNCPILKWQERLEVYIQFWQEHICASTPLCAFCL
jgi:hypothetical protein